MARPPDSAANPFTESFMGERFTPEDVVSMLNADLCGAAGSGNAYGELNCRGYAHAHRKRGYAETPSLNEIGPMKK